MNSAVKKIAIGLALTSLPLVLCWVLAEFLLLTATTANEPRLEQEKRNTTGLIILTGLIMSGIAYCGMLLYSLSIIYEYAVVQRHARKIERMKRDGQIN